jgi:hypothetical protein
LPPYDEPALSPRSSFSVANIEIRAAIYTSILFGWTERASNPGTMADRTYIVRFKQPEGSAEIFVASSAEIHGDHIVLLNSNGQLAALFLLEFVESWNEV